MLTDNLVHALLAEFLGTAVLVLLGCGACANSALARNKSNGTLGWLGVSFGWGFAVMAGVYVAFYSGSYINPALTLGTVANGATEFSPHVAVNAASIIGYIVAEFLGGAFGAILVWLVYKKQFDEETNPDSILGTFATGPAVRSYGWNFTTEVIATFVVAFVAYHFGGNPAQLGPLPSAFLFVAVGIGLGGPTGFSLNPARDFSPRLIHSILPIPHKGDSDWGYAHVGVLGPIVGAVLAGFVAQALPYLPV